MQMSSTPDTGASPAGTGQTGPEQQPAQDLSFKDLVAGKVAVGLIHIAHTLSDHDSSCTSYRQSGAKERPAEWGAENDPEQQQQQQRVDLCLDTSA